MNVRDFTSLDEAKSFVRAAVKSALEADIKQKGQASLILTGGNTVRPFLEALTALDIAWEKVWVVLSDERWVPVTDNMSNEKQLRELFLNNLKNQPHYISLKTDHISPAEAISILETNISFAPQPFTCALLSIGDDGHVASLFPGDNWGLPYVVTHKLGINRISLGLQHFYHANHNLILVHDSRKSVIEQIAQEKIDSPIKFMLDNSNILMWKDND